MHEPLYQNKYRIKSTRLSSYDYSSVGRYFVTICVKNRKCLLGDVKNNKIVLSDIGKIVDKYWQEIPDHYDNVTLNEYVIMPNHIHGIIVINPHVDTHHDAYLQKNKFITHGDKRSLLSVIIGRIKMQSAKQIHQIYPSFAWQPRFYDHVIRNEQSLQRIKEYIIFNPYKWDDDVNNPSKSILKRKSL